MWFFILLYCSPTFLSLLKDPTHFVQIAWTHFLRHWDPKNFWKLRCIWLEHTFWSTASAWKMIKLQVSDCTCNAKLTKLFMKLSPLQKHGNMVLPSHTALGQDYTRSLPQSSRMEPGQSWRDGPHQNDLASTLLPFLFLVFHSSEYSTKGEEGTSIIYKPWRKHLPNYKTYWLNWLPLFFQNFQVTVAILPLHSMTGPC